MHSLVRREQVPTIITKYCTYPKQLNRNGFESLKIALSFFVRCRTGFQTCTECASFRFFSFLDFNLHPKAVRFNVK